jgi:hypothetical protein
MAVRKIRVGFAAENTIANTTAVTNSNNVGDLPATVNAVLAAMVALGLVKNS